MVWICTDRNQIGGKCTLLKCNDKIIIIYQNLACFFFCILANSRCAERVCYLYNHVVVLMFFLRRPQLIVRIGRFVFFAINCIQPPLLPPTCTLHGSANMLSSIAFFLIFCLFPKFGCRHIFFSVRLFCKQCRTFMHKRFTAARCKQSNKAHNGRNMVN